MSTHQLMTRGHHYVPVAGSNNNEILLTVLQERYKHFSDDLFSLGILN